MGFTYRKGNVVEMEAHPELDHVWLQARLVEEPALLRLGSDLALQTEAEDGGLLFYDASGDRYLAVYARPGTADAELCRNALSAVRRVRDHAPEAHIIPVVAAERFPEPLVTVLLGLQRAAGLIPRQLLAVRLETGNRLTLVAAPLPLPVVAA